jgi:hypothetical protein
LKRRRTRRGFPSPLRKTPCSRSSKGFAGVARRRNGSGGTSLVYSESVPASTPWAQLRRTRD